MLHRVRPFPRGMSGMSGGHDAVNELGTRRWIQAEARLAFRTHTHGRIRMKDGFDSILTSFARHPGG